MSRELLKQALEALVELHYCHTDKVEAMYDVAVDAICEYLAQPEQEPVACVVDAGGVCHFPKLQWKSANHSLETPIGSDLYLHPRTDACWHGASSERAYG